MEKSQLNPTLWSNLHVLKWLDEIYQGACKSQIKQSFKINEITGIDLVELTKEEIANDLHINSLNRCGITTSNDLCEIRIKHGDLKDLVYTVLGSDCTFGNLITQSAYLWDLNPSEIYYLSLKLNSNDNSEVRVFPNDSKILPYLKILSNKTSENSIILFLKKIEPYSCRNEKEVPRHESPKSNSSVDNKSLTYNNQLTETESKCEYKLTEGQFNTNKDQELFDDEPIDNSKCVINKNEQNTKKEPSHKPNNKRYLTKEINEDEFFNKMITDVNNDLMLSELEIDDYDKDQLLTKNKMFATSNVNHAEIFEPILSNKNTIDYQSREIKEKVEEKLKSRSYNGTHKRQTTFNFPTFDKTLDKMSTSDGQSSEFYFKSKRIAPFLKTQRDNKLKYNVDITNKNLLENESKYGGSFDEKPFINFLCPKDSLTEQRNSRRNINSQKGFDYTVNDTNNQFYINNKENIEVNQIENKKYLKKKKTNNSNLIKLKENSGTYLGRHTRTNSKSNLLQAPSSCANIPSCKNSKSRKNHSKKSSKSNNRKESKSNCSKENTNAIETSSKRYSEGLFKDTVFDSKDDSTSGINELNLLQELTNFTNMKMLKNKKNKQSQHCIHFERIITN